MADYRLPSFNACHRKLDKRTRAQFRYAYRQYQRDPRLVEFAQKGRFKDGTPVFGARIDGNWRALATKEGDDVLWFWAGLHTDYDRMLKGLSK